MPHKREQQLQTLTSRIEILPFGQPEAKIAATVRASLEKLGSPIGPLDNLIAGIALSNNAILVTRNTKEFNRVEGLIVENWY